MRDIKSTYAAVICNLTPNGFMNIAPISYARAMIQLKVKNI
jgi:hypothetical protein